uniref:AT-hook containing transcription factor 1 n=1 Tax=Varanus komodoensis TaxID=61221 RepID=A0A8D2J3V6_VARKO
MRDLTAHVTSSLLQFPEVTVQALGEDEITIDCVLHGKFTGGRSGLAYLACGPQLEIVNPATGERLSAYRFSGVTEQPPTVLAVKEFSWQKRTGVLIGLEETEGSVLCLYDLGISRVVKAVVLPGRVSAIEPIINHGGASLTTQHLHQSLRWLFGVAAVVTDIGHVLLIDLCLDDLSCSQNEIEASDLEVITGTPPEIPQIREAITRKGRHLCFQLLNPSGTAVTTLSYIHRSNQLVVGFSDGYLSLWNMKTLKKEYHSQLEGGRIPVYAVTFQEPENDPRNCCYLWAIQSTQESEGDIVSFHLLQLAFSDRRRLASGQIMYEGLEYCEERYSLDLTGGVFSLRGQTSNTKLIGCQTVEKFRSHVDREDGINEVISPDTSVSVFSWQVNTYGQGKPSTYLGIFDINRWYHAQMPDSLRPGEFLHNCPYFALWSLDAVVSITSPHRILDVLVHERSFNRGVPPSYPPPEQFFNPSTYNFDATCLLNSGVIHLTCTGFQKDTLHFLKKSGCCLNEAIPDGYNRCLVAGLLSPRFIDAQPSSLSQEEQFEAVLSAAIQTSSLGLLTSCIKQWTSEEQPDSAPNLHFVLDWTWNKVVKTKEEFVRLCAPLFDGSSNFTDPQTLQSLQHCELLLSNLSTVLNCFVMEAQELTEKGITDLTNKQLVTSLLSQYVQVVIWFCRSSLLPESSDEDMELSRPFYNYQQIQRFYASCRQKLEHLSRGKWNPDCLMIDGMISQLGDPVVKLWQRDDGGTGKYPPPTLHALLDLYLLENIDELYKHATTIYLLLDIMHSCPNRNDTSVDSFPTVFAVPLGLVNLIQGFWCLDHNDFENSLTYLFHPATIKLHWQHMRIIQALMCQGEHRRALRYIQTMKPSMMSSSEVALHLTVLLFNSCMVEAWSVLRQHSTRLNVEEMLKHVYEICQELGLMEDLLKLPFTETEQECLEKFLHTSTGVNNHEFLLVHHLQRANYIPALQLNQSLKTNLMNDPRWRERSVARNSILDQYGKVLPRVQRKLAIERAKPYHLSSSLRREILRPKPLSTVAKQAATGNVVTKATFINNVLSKIGEVWVGNEQKNNSEEQPPRKDLCSDTELPDPFVGTPVIKSSRKHSRLLDLVVQPVSLDSPAPGNSLQLSPRVSASCVLSSPLHSNPRCSIRTLLHKNFTRAPELKLLETPPVVKVYRTRAKALTSTSSSGFTPQSILRSSVRTTPLVTPTASPARSITPPLRAKETKISFMEESEASQWTAGMTDHKTKHSAISSEYNYNLEAQMEDTWTKNRKTPSFSACRPQENHEEMDLLPECIPSDPLDKTESSKETNNTFAKSAKTSLQYHGTKPSVDLGDGTFIASQPSIEREGTEIVGNDSLQTEQQSSEDVEQSAGMSFDIIVYGYNGNKRDGPAVVDQSRETPILGMKLGVTLPSAPSNRRDCVSSHRYEKHEVQVSEALVEALPYNELYPSNSLKFQYNCDTVEQQVTGELLGRDTDETPFTEGDGDLLSPNNFTLILEGDDEAEMGESTVLQTVPDKSASPKPEGEGLNNIGSNIQEFPTNSASTVTSDQKALNTAEILPYDPQPIRTAAAENLLDVIRVTNNEFSAEVVEQSPQENISKKTPLQNILETKEDIKLSHLVMSSTSTTKHSTQSPKVTKSDDQPMTKIEKPELSVLPTPRRSARRAKETSDIPGSLHLSPKRKHHDQQTPQAIAFPVKTKECDLEIAADVHPIAQEFQATITTRKGVRKPKQLAVEPHEQPPSARRRAARTTRNLAGDQESSQLIIDHTIQMTVNPKSTRKLKTIALHLAENVISGQEVESHEQQLPVQRKRGRPRKNPFDVSANALLDLSLSSPPPPTDTKPSVTTRRNTRSGASNLSTSAGCLPSLESSAVSTTTKRSRRIRSAGEEKTNAEKSNIDEHSVQPREAVISARSSEKKQSKITTIRKRGQLPSLSEEGTEEEELLTQTTDNVAELQSTDMAKLRLDETRRTLTDKRTRYSKKSVKQSLYLDVNEAFYFSPPLTKLTEKTKGEQAVTPVQLKGLDASLTSQFVFSPPVLRSRKKQASTISRIELPIKEEKDVISIETLEKQKVKRSRATRSKASKVLGKDGSWSPPPMEIKFISPFGTPVDGAKGKQKEAVDKAEKVAQKTLRRKEKRLSSYPKPVVRKKML